MDLLRYSHLESDVKRKTFIALALFFILISGIAVVRSLVFGMDIDEEYSVALAYRIASGDTLIKEMYEPHQLSAILPAVFVKLFTVATGGCEYLCLYLRFLGIVFAFVVSLAWYLSLSKTYNKQLVFLTAVIVFNTFPKGIVSLEFTNAELWMLLLTGISLFNYFHSSKNIHIILAGIFMVFEVLAYPSCVLLFPFFLVILLKKKKIKAALIFAGECVLSAGAFLTYLLSRMTFNELLSGIGYVMSDEEHSEGFISKLLGRIGEFPEILIYCLAYALIGFMISFVICKVFSLQNQKSDNSLWTLFPTITIAIALLDQLRLWLFCGEVIVYPQIIYLIAMVYGGFLYAKGMRTDSDTLLLKLFYIPGIIALFCVLLLSNLTIKSALIHLISSVLCMFLWLDSPEEERPKSRKWPVYLLSILWCIVIIAGRIYMVRDGGFNNGNINFVKQKILYGPGKYIYAPYMTGYMINEEQDFLMENIPAGSKVWYLGTHNLIYIANDYEVCTSSTISTPVYNQTCLDYFDINPEKIPEYVIISKEFNNGSESKITSDVRLWIEEHYERIDSENEYLLIYESKQ